MAECSKCGSPVCKCGPLHYNESPLNIFGSLASTAAMAAAGRFSARSMFNSLNKNNSRTSTTRGALSREAAGAMNTGQTPSATSTTSGALAGATPDAGMLSNPSPQNDNSSDLESRVTALEQNAPSNTLGNAKPVFDPATMRYSQGIYGQQQVPGTFDRSLDPTVAAPLMKKRKY